MKLTFLGTGTSTGIPQIGCNCPTCKSVDPRDSRQRASAILTTDTGQNILIDCGPDFRQQILRFGSPRLDALLITHIHYDHVGGIDDLRPYCYRLNGFPLYCAPDVNKALHDRLPYCFAADHYPGAPTFKMHTIHPGQEFSIGQTKILPLPVMHGSLPILGFRIGNLAYITDCKTLPPQTLSMLSGVTTLVINALRHKEHPAHMNLLQALDVINSVKPVRACLTHLSHDMGPHADTELTLPPGVEIATDGQVITL